MGTYYAWVNYTKNEFLQLGAGPGVFGHSSMKNPYAFGNVLALAVLHRLGGWSGDVVSLVGDGPDWPWEARSDGAPLWVNAWTAHAWAFEDLEPHELKHAAEEVGYREAGKHADVTRALSARLGALEANHLALLRMVENQRDRWHNASTACSRGAAAALGSLLEFWEGRRLAAGEPKLDGSQTCHVVPDGKTSCVLCGAETKP